MLSLIVATVALGGQVAAFPAGERVIVLPGAPAMKYTDHRPAGSLLFRGLVSEGRSPDGKATFKTIDGSVTRELMANPSNPNLALTVVPVVESPALTEIRRKYLGKKVWFYGGWPVFVESPAVGSLQDVDVEPTESCTIKAVYQLKNQSIRFDGPNLGGEWPMASAYVPSNKSPSGPLLFIYRFPSSHSRDAWDPGQFNPCYNVIPANWSLDHIFSLVPPTRKGLTAIARVPHLNDMGDISSKVAGMTHWEVAWACGFPNNNAPVAELLKRSHWHEYFWDFDFNGDSLTKAYNYMSH